MRGERKKKKKDCCWRRCSKSLCLKNSLVLPFISKYIGSAQLSGSQHYIWNSVSWTEYCMLYATGLLLLLFLANLIYHFILHNECFQQSQVYLAHAFFVKGYLNNTGLSVASCWEFLVFTARMCFSLLDLVDLVVKRSILCGNKTLTCFVSYSTQCPQLYCMYFMYQRMKKMKKSELGLGILSFISWIHIVPIHHNTVGNENT